MPLKSSMLMRSTKPKARMILPSRKDSYTTNDLINGYVTTVAQLDAHCSSVDVNFIGTSRTTSTVLSPQLGKRRSEAVHQFLNLRQPDVDLHLPVDSILRSGREYKIPVELIVPASLLPQSCKVTKGSNNVKEAHFQLPPSLSNGDEWADCFAPCMADIQYGVQVRINGCQNKTDRVIASRFHSVSLAPAAAFLPPIDQRIAPEDYKTLAENTVKRMSLASSQGTITVWSRQLSIRMTTARNDVSGCTMVELEFQYELGSDQKTRPPVIDSISTSLQGITHYATRSQQTFPSRAGWASAPTQGIYSNSIKLATLGSPNMDWQYQQSDNCFTTTLQVPVRMATGKIVVPTFHSCLVSRVYSVRIRINFKSDGPSTSLELSVPLQTVRGGSRGGDMSA